MRRAILLLALLGALRADEADRIVREEMEKQHIPGVTVAVLREGRLVKAEGYGLANIELSVPATVESVFRIGSVSKQFIAAAILVLQQDGRLSIDDRIKMHLGDAPDSWNGITLRHLLSHTSGIQREGPLFSPLRQVPDAQVVRGAYHMPLDFKPGEKVQYSNLSYFVLAEVVSRVGGKPWSEFLRERVLQPLGMGATRPTTHDELVPHRADGYIWRDGSFLNAAALLSVRPSGALLSTVLDLAKWDAALYSDQPLSAQSRQTAWTEVKLNGGAGSGYGLGWRVNESGGRRYISHGGTLSGFKSEFVRFLDDKLSVIVLTNSEDGEPGRIAHRLAAVFLAPAGAELR